MYAFQRIQSFLSGILWYELSFFYVDVLFIIYLSLLVKSFVRNSRITTSEEQQQGGRPQQSGPDFALDIKASNWIVGMVIGVLASLTVLFGSKATRPKLPQALLTITLGTVTCVLADSLIVLLFTLLDKDCWNEEEEAQDLESCKDEEEQGGSFAAHVV
jgi:Na+/proline symporter